jgi:hypothetical protein
MNGGIVGVMRDLKLTDKKRVEPVALWAEGSDGNRLIFPGKLPSSPIELAAQVLRHVSEFRELHPRPTLTVSERLGELVSIPDELALGKP